MPCASLSVRTFRWGGGKRRAPAGRSRLRLEHLGERVVPATFVVNDAGDDGNGTLAWAIVQANETAGRDEIHFAIDEVGTAETITLTSALPPITEQVVIDGFTQGGQVPTDVPWVHLVGGGLTGDGLTLNADNVTVRGLTVSGFAGNGIVIANPGTMGCHVYACYVGAYQAGLTANTLSGIRITGKNNVVGDDWLGVANTVISGNTGNGVTITGAGATGNTVVSSRIGTSVDGTAARANGASGVLIVSSATQNKVGVEVMFLDLGNVISGNGLRGVYISGASGNQVWNNYIGLNAAGTAAVGNGSSGVTILGDSVNNQVNDSIISGNGGHGVSVSGPGPTSNKVRGSRIGTRGDGSAAVGNTLGGVRIELSQNNEIGGTAEGQGNVISGNGGNGITITGSTAKYNKVFGNVIGLAAVGDTVIGNAVHGIFVTSNENTIGAADNGLNVISGNGDHGIHVTGSFNVIVNNYIGTTKDGEDARGNGGNGIFLDVGACSNEIGSSSESLRNVISANAGDGIRLKGTGDGTNSRLNVIAGNYIGVMKDGLQKAGMGNKENGIFLERSRDNTIGGDSTLYRNIIASNTLVGVCMGAGARDNLVKFNTIGLDAANTQAINVQGWQFDPQELNLWTGNAHN